MHLQKFQTIKKAYLIVADDDSDGNKENNKHVRFAPPKKEASKPTKLAKPYGVRNAPTGKPANKSGKPTSRPAKQKSPDQNLASIYKPKGNQQKPSSDFRSGLKVGGDDGKGGGKDKGKGDGKGDGKDSDGRNKGGNNGKDGPGSGNDGQKSPTDSGKGKDGLGSGKDRGDGSDKETKGTQMIMTKIRLALVLMTKTQRTQGIEIRIHMMMEMMEREAKEMERVPMVMEMMETEREDLQVVTEKMMSKMERMVTIMITEVWKW